MVTPFHFRIRLLSGLLLALAVAAALACTTSPQTPEPTDTPPTASATSLQPTSTPTQPAATEAATTPTLTAIPTEAQAPAVVSTPTPGTTLGATSTLEPVPQATELPTLTSTPTPTTASTPAPTLRPTATPTPTPEPTPTPTPQPTPTPAPTPTQIPGREALYETIQVPEHLSYARWFWTLASDFETLVYDFTIHNDPGDFSNRYGLYLMVHHGEMSGSGFYFGLQTDVWDPAINRGRGKGLIFSIWGQRNLDEARPACDDDCWVQESGHEGDFIGVRRAYEWDTGDYRMWLAPDGQEEGGEWYGVWLTDLDDDETVWVGSLKFPDEDGDADLAPWGYSTLEIYGQPTILPIDIPEWYVSMDPPEGDDIPARWTQLGYGGTNGQTTSNSDVQYRDGQAHLHIGGTTIQVGEPTDGYLEIE